MELTKQDVEMDVACDLKEDFDPHLSLGDNFSNNELCISQINDIAPNNTVNMVNELISDTGKVHGIVINLVVVVDVSDIILEEEEACTGVL